MSAQPKNTKLINELRATLAKEFSRRLAEVIPLVSDALFEVSNVIEDADAKRAVLGARDAWETRAGDWEQGVYDDYIKRFNQKLSGEDDQLSKTMTFSVDSLKLVDDDEMREEILLGNLAKRLKDACDYELFAMTKRFEGLSEVTALADRQNPVLPSVFCRAMLTGLEVAEITVSQRCEILSAGAEVIGEVLNGTLKEGNEVLVSRGFMIEIPAAYGKLSKSAASQVQLSLSTGPYEAMGGVSAGGNPNRRKAAPAKSTGSSADGQGREDGAGGAGSVGDAGGGRGESGAGSAGGTEAEIHASLPGLFARLLARLPAVEASAPTGGAASMSASGAAAVSADQFLAQLLTATPGAPAANGGAAPEASATTSGGAAAAARNPAGGGVQVTLDPKLLEALERFAVHSAATAAPVLPAIAETSGTSAVGAAATGDVAAAEFPAVLLGATTEPADALGPDQTQPLPALQFDLHNAPTERLDAIPRAAPQPVLTNLIRQAAPVLAPTMQPVQTVITDVLAGVFDKIFEAPDVPDSIKALIGKLQLQIFKASMQDPQIFTNAEHPIRRFVDELADIGIKRQQSLRQGDPVYERIATIVSNLHQNFDVDPDAIERANHQLSAFIQAEEDSAQGVIFDSVVEVQQQEEVEMGASLAAFEIDRRFAGKLYLRKLKEFVSTHWHAVLAKDYLIDGEDGDQWKADLVTLDELLWSISPADAGKDRAKLLKLLPTLLGRLNAGLDRVGISHDVRDPYFQMMVAVHTSLLRPSKQGADPTSADEVEAQSVATAEDPRARLRKRTTSIARGQWIEMTDDNGAVQRCRLSWVSPLKETFVLKNYDTKEAVTLSAEEFQILDGQGRIKLIEEHSLTERSIQGAILGMLDKPDAAAVPATAN